jgi:hypothetical protein
MDGQDLGRCTSPIGMQIYISGMVSDGGILIQQAAEMTTKIQEEIFGSMGIGKIAVMLLFD